ncbi:GMP synthase (glutamine-hydrolyzing) [Teratosphaeriaceae sp. CCFEE 6253]|nr:GMP synthase (glutamine-hydrolyzing) [Teratosphaeriaceae sp. CCFEE 6253]
MLETNGIASNGAAMDPAPPHETFDTILVLDFGSQYTHLITRRLRELNVYSEMLPCTQKLADLSWKPKGVILSGGPYSVYAPDAPHVDPEVFHLEVPILGICYGLQEIAWHHGKNVLAGEKREYGHAELNTHPQEGKLAHVSRLFEGLPDEMNVWMSHGDKLSRMPEGFVTIATTSNSPYAGIAHEEKEYYGIQFHPEVTHTPNGSAVIENFAVKICKAQQNWNMEAFKDKEVMRIKKLVGERGQVIGAVSGGVDSTVAAKLMHAAIGDRFHAVMVDNGVLRREEAKQVKKTLTEGLGVNLTVIDASERFLNLLKGVADPEKKRKIIGNTFIEIFEETAKKIAKEAEDTPKAGKIEYFLQGTLYPDVIESISFKGPSATIKTHHNVGGLPEKMNLKLIEPLRELFKDEVRKMGRDLGIAAELVGRHPFPGPGLAIRIIGEVTPEKVRVVQHADAIFIEEIRNAGLYDEISQAFAALMEGKAVGVVGDQRLHGHIIALRAVVTTDFMTADAYEFPAPFLRKVKNRIGNEVEGVARVLYEITSKPPATIEFE